MLEELVNLDRLPHFKQAELERRLDDVLLLIDEGQSPVVIHDDKGRRFLMFSWEDYFSRFRWLYTKDELEELERACREYEEDTNDLLYK